MPSEESTPVSEEQQPDAEITEESAEKGKRMRLPLWQGLAAIVLLTTLLYGGTISYGITNWDDTWLIDNKWLSTFVENDLKGQNESVVGMSKEDLASIEAQRQENASQALAHIWNPRAPREIREDLGNEFLPIRDMSYVLSFELSPKFFRDLPANAPNMVRLINIMLHAMNGVLIFLLVAALTRRRWMALAVGLIFVSMPIHVESVVWLASRKELLSAFFMLLALACYVRARHREKLSDGKSISPTYFALFVLSFIAALLSKTPALVLPGLVLLLELARPKIFATRSIKATAITIGGILGISILHFALISYPLADNGLVRGYYGDSFGDSLLTSLAAQGRYWMAMLSGTANIPAYDHPLVEGINLMVAIGAGMLALSVVAFVWLLRAYLKKQDHSPTTVISFGLAWFAMAFVPVSNLLIQIGTVYADRYAYVPSIGLIVALVFGLDWLLRIPKDKRYALFGCATLIFLFVAWQGLRVMGVRMAWQDSTTLWERTLELQPDNHLALFNAGVSVQETGMRTENPENRLAYFEDAKAYYRRALKQPGHTFRYDYARAHLALAELAFSEIDGHVNTIKEREAALAAFDKRYEKLESNEDRESRRAEITRAIEQAEAKRDAAISVAIAHAENAKHELNQPWRGKRDRNRIRGRIHDLLGRVAFATPAKEGEATPIEKALDHFEEALKNEGGEGESSAPISSYLNAANTLATKAQNILAEKGYGEKSLARVKPLFEKAIAHVEEFIQRNQIPTAEALETRAIIKLHFGEAIEGLARRTPPEAAAKMYREAAEDFLHAISYISAKRYTQTRKLHDTLIKLAEALQRLPSQEEAALSIVRRAIREDSSVPLSHLFEARLLMRLGKAGEAISVLRRMLSEEKFPDYLPARIEYASLVIASATAKRDKLIAEWTTDYRDQAAREGVELPDVVAGDKIIRYYYQREEFKKDYTPIIKQARLAADQMLSLEEAETNEQAREIRKAGAEFLVQAGSALYQAGELGAAGEVLLQAFRLDETVKGVEALLAELYLKAAEDASKLRQAALAVKDLEEAKKYEDQYWQNITGLLVLSTKARTGMAHRMTRKANQIRANADKTFFHEEMVPMGKMREYGGKATYQKLRPEKTFGDYVLAMSEAVELYQTAHLFAPEYPDPLTQLVDYYERTKQFDRAVETFRKLEQSLSKPDQLKHRNAVRETLGVHLIRWGASLVGQFREMAKFDAKRATKLRVQAVEKYTEAWETFNRLMDEERLRPLGVSRRILQNAGVIAQELAKLTHPQEWIWYSRALDIYREKPSGFEIELIAVLQQIAIFTEDRSEKLAYLNEALEIAENGKLLEKEKQKKTIQESIKWIHKRESFENAEKAFQEGDYKSALKTLDKADLHYPRAELLRGQILEKLDQAIAAAEAYQRGKSIDRAAVRAAELLLTQGKEAALQDAAFNLRSAQRSLDWKSAEAKAEGRDASEYDSLLERIDRAQIGLDAAATRLVRRATDKSENLNAKQRVSLLETAGAISRTPFMAFYELARYRSRLGKQALEIYRGASADNEPAKMVAGFKATAERHIESAWQSYLELDRIGAPFAWQTLLDAAEFGYSVVLPLRSEAYQKERVLSACQKMLEHQDSAIQRELDSERALSQEKKEAFISQRNQGKALAAKIQDALKKLDEE